MPLVVIQHRAENLRIVDVFGPAALTVLPRVGVRIDLADPTHHVIETSTVEFEIPPRATTAAAQ